MQTLQVISVCLGCWEHAGMLEVLLVCSKQSLEVPGCLAVHRLVLLRNAAMSLF